MQPRRRTGFRSAASRPARKLRGTCEQPVARRTPGRKLSGCRSYHQLNRPSLPSSVVIRMNSTLRPTRLSVLFLLFSASLVVSPFSADAAAKPNDIYIMADELGYYEPSFMGGRNIQTPNLD